MKQYIDKAIIMAEIERRINEYETPVDRLGSNNIRLHECKDLLSFLDTLEVKDVDLKKEIELVKGDYEQVDVAWNNDFDFIAKHFFEHGLKAQKEIFVIMNRHNAVIIEIERPKKITFTHFIQYLIGRIMMFLSLYRNTKLNALRIIMIKMEIFI